MLIIKVKIYGTNGKENPYGAFVTCIYSIYEVQGLRNQKSTVTCFDRVIYPIYIIYRVSLM